MPMADEERRKVRQKRSKNVAVQTDISPETQQQAKDLLDSLRRQGLEPALMVEAAIEETYMTAHRGPLPSPEDMREYEQVLPGLAERIVARAENEQKHRHAMNERILEAEKGLKNRGQFFAFAALLAMLGVVVYIVYMGAPTAAAALGSAIIASVVAAFVLGNRKSEEPTTTEVQVSE
jgi:uncharacterized membrane protein